jgi:N-acetylglucosamine-6-phosphate deacetylase
MSLVSYKSTRIYTEEGVTSGYLTVENGKIVSIDSNVAPDSQVIDFEDAIVLPGIIDTHNHGRGGNGFHMDRTLDEKVENLRQYSRNMAKIGVTCSLPIVKEFYIDAVKEVIRDVLPSCKIIGLHCEGPFLNRAGENARYEPPKAIDLLYAQQLIDRYDGLMKVMSYSYELQGADKLTTMLKDRGIRCSLAHTNGRSEETKVAFRAGLDAVTHLGNAMTGIHHRNVGCFGAAMLDDSIWTEVICDGHHLSVEMLKIVFKVKEPSRIMMVSDGSALAGLPIGAYPSYFNEGAKIFIKEDGTMIDENGRLCGSGLSVLDGMGLLINQLNIPIEQVWRFASLNPAIRYGIADQKGSLSVNKDADFIVLDPDLRLIATYLEGNNTYKAEVV